MREALRAEDGNNSTKLPIAGVSQGHITFSDFSFLHSDVNGYAFLYICYSLYAIEMVVKL